MFGKLVDKLFKIDKRPSNLDSGLVAKISYNGLAYIANIEENGEYIGTLQSPSLKVLSMGLTMEYPGVILDTSGVNNG